MRKRSEGMDARGGHAGTDVGFDRDERVCVDGTGTTQTGLYMLSAEVTCLRVNGRRCVLW